MSPLNKYFKDVFRYLLETKNKNLVECLSQYCPYMNVLRSKLTLKIRLW